MFDGDLNINGKHATYIKYLVNEVKAFQRYIDVYMLGAIIGILKEKRANQGDSSDRARIYADVFSTENLRCNEIFKIVILNDKSKDWSDEERVNICFRYRDKKDKYAVPCVTDAEVNIMKEAFDLFNSYVFGGIEILYDYFSTDVVIGEDETIDYAYKFIYDQNALIESMQDEIDINQLLRPEY